MPDACLPAASSAQRLCWTPCASSRDLLAVRARRARSKRNGAAWAVRQGLYMLMLGMIVRRVLGGLLTLPDRVCRRRRHQHPAGRRDRGDPGQIDIARGGGRPAQGARPRPAGHERYLRWLAGLLSGDPGVSLINRLPVAQLIGRGLANSLLLTALTAAVAVPLALLIGITTAIWRGTLYDRVANVTAVSLVARAGVPAGDGRRDALRRAAALGLGIGQAVDRLVHRGLAEFHLAGADALLRRDGADGAHDPRRAARRASIPPTSRWRG